ncbi:MAG: hypothetical protein LBK50_03075 [Candidatus Nomurabacteria bacterium]|jgi:hypothetical protein|nr:hypothetical protein [Candidatus Nomurabacteria bacterium]
MESLKSLRQLEEWKDRDGAPKSGETSSLCRQNLHISYILENLRFDTNRIAALNEAVGVKTHVLTEHDGEEPAVVHDARVDDGLRLRSFVSKIHYPKLYKTFFDFDFSTYMTEEGGEWRTYITDLAICTSFNRQSLSRFMTDVMSENSLDERQDVTAHCKLYERAIEDSYKYALKSQLYVFNVATEELILGSKYSFDVPDFHRRKRSRRKAINETIRKILSKGDLVTIAERNE